MKNLLKKSISLMLVVAMLSSLAPAVFAQSEPVEGESMVDFSATDYSFKEDDSVVDITVKRHGGNATDARITFKVADFISTYGEDYVVLDEESEPYEKVYGEKPEMSELVYDEEDYPSEMPIDTDDVSEEAPVDEEILEEEAAQEITYTKERRSTGSELLDAQAAYLNLPVAEEDNEEVKNEANEVLGDMYGYFAAAEGAVGYLDFEAGETEKDIRIKIFDNDVAEKDKLFVIALMSSDAEEVKISAAATTYVTIEDDEEYVKPHIELVDEGLVLSEAMPESTVTLRRTGGTDYFATVYVSTVKGSADYEAYKNIDTEAVAFVPGETEKQIKVEAYDFAKNSSFGVRLEGDKSVEIGNHYIDISIEAGQDESAELLAESDEEATLMGDVTLGSSYTEKTLNNISGGWGSDVTTGNLDGKSAWVTNNDLWLYESTKNAGRGWTTNQAQNIVGIQKIDFYTMVSGKGSAFTTYFEIDSSRKWSGSTTGVSYSGKTDGWVRKSLDVSKYNGNYYYQFSTKVTKAGSHNPDAYLGNPLMFYWAKYNLSSADSLENFNRKAYDFIEGSPNVQDIYYDSYDERGKKLVFNPGPVVIKNGSNNVTGFYANNTSAVTVESKYAKENEAKGIYLKEIRIANADLSDSKVYDKTKETYLNDKVYVISADKTTHKVTFTPDQNFVKNLMNAGVLKSDKTDSASLKIYPVYAQEMVTVNFENADNNGYFSEENKGSYINNIFGLNRASGKDTSHNNAYVEFYTMSVPKYSVVRVQMTPLSTRTPNGILHWPHGNGNAGKITYYKEGETIHTGGNDSGKATITETDFSKAEIVASSNMSIRPVTDKQTFYVGYSPLAYPMRPVDDLSGVVYDTNGSFDEETGEYTGDKTDSEGKMWLTDPFIGKNYTINAIAPEGYYASWKNMTGDTNNNGTVGDSGDVYTDSDLETMNPDEILGNILPVTLDQNNTRYQYYLAPKTVSATVSRQGRVVREKRSLFEIKTQGEYVKNVKTEPVVGAYVNIGGTTTMTNGNGEYSVDINLPSPWGHIGATVMVGDVQYSKSISIVNQLSEIRLNALESSRLKGLSAGYISADTPAGDRRMIASDQNGIDVKDQELTVTVKVEDMSAIETTDARFFIYDKYGYEKIDCSEDEGYNITTSRSGSTLTAEIRFNPKRDLVLGDKLYVQFADQNGKWYHPIDTGYNFIVPLELDEFVLSLMGSETLDDVMHSGFVVDVLGDPLGDLDLGLIPGFEEPESNLYTPPLVPESEKADYTWYTSDYSFGGELLFKGMNLGSTNKSYEKDMKEYLFKVQQGDFDGKVPQKSKYKTKSLFSWNVTPTIGFNLRLSLRGEKYYFEDLAFCVNIAFGVSANQRISLPMGFGILIKFNLSGSVTGIYHMYTDYQDMYETESAVLYDPATFGMFKSMTNVRREGYLFVDPNISFSGIVKFLIVGVGLEADFELDMDFRFTESGADAYGDIYIDLDFVVDVLSFTVYSTTIVGDTFKLFNTEGQNGHIEYDTSDIMPSLLSMAMSEGEPSVDTASSRDYLENRGSWNGGNEAGLLDIDVTSGTTETELLSGVPKLSYMKSVKLSNGNIFTVFVDDAVGREAKNYGRLMWTFYNGSEWSEPQALCDDGTFDAFPEVVNMGDDKVMVAWSSVETVLDEDADVQEALEGLGIQTLMFDVSGDVPTALGEAETLTKPDGFADVLPKLTYMEDADQVVLYYTKMEFEDITDETIENIGDANSTIMYLVYDGNYGIWCNSGDTYTDEELDGMDEDEKIAFREKWYGQRFLYLQLGDDISNMPMIMEIDAESYKDTYSVISWVVDWDKDKDTVYDRDVFMQIYKTDTHEATEIIRVTNETAYYSSPQFESSDNTLYIFFGSMKEDEDKGYIKYYNITDIVNENKYTLTSAENRDYYELKYTEPVSTYVDRLGNEYEIPEEEIVLNGGIAAETSSISEFDIFVDELGRLFLFWAESKDGMNNIFMTMHASPDDEDDETEGEWSEEFSVISSEDEFYSGVEGVTYNGNIIIKATKTEAGTENRKLVLLKHVPFENIAIDMLCLDTESPKANKEVMLTATVANTGINTHTEPVTVNFTVNGEIVATETIEHKIYGGQTYDVTVPVTVPEDVEGAEFGAYIEGQEPVSINCVCKAEVEFNYEEIITKEDGSFAYRVILYNDGNVASEEITVNATIGEEVVGTTIVEPIEAGETITVEVDLDVKDSMFTITNGNGIVDVAVKAELPDGKNLTIFNGTCNKVFDAEAVGLLSNVTEITFENDGVYNLKVKDMEDIQPEIEGAEGLYVRWTDSSNENAVKIKNNIVCAEGKGSSILTGVVVPNKQILIFDSVGNGYEGSVLDMIPDNLVKEVTAVVKVASKTGTISSSDTSVPGGSGSTTDDVDVENGRITETTKYEDGSSLVVVTEKDGKVTTTYTDAKGTVTETVSTADGETTAKVTLADGEENVTVKIPYNNADESTVAVIVKENGETEVVKNCVPEEDGLIVPLNASVNLKVVNIDAEFTDVTGHWAEANVDFVTARGLFNGTGENTFTPDGSLTRGMLVTVLYRAEGEPATNRSIPFEDVDMDEYYGNAVSWAKQTGIVNGVTENEFAPDEKITREQIATIFYRYAQYKGVAPEGAWAIRLDYADLADISEYAIDGVMFCKLSGIMQGKENNIFAPKDDATRAEAAAMLQRFITYSCTNASK